MIQLTINGEVRQEASIELMIRNTFELVSVISRYFTLYPGDVVLTGTPAVAGILPSKSVLQLKLDNRYQFKASAV
jgi:2-keto-4-pentenoate hydratase/2-oxohepta-3-ene-1,7-dioic acid hydratase in catechol pathway